LSVHFIEHRVQPLVIIWLQIKTTFAK